MKVSELRQKNTEELQQELLALFREQFSLRMQQSMGQLSKPHLFRQVRRNIARTKMVLHEKTEATKV